MVLSWYFPLPSGIHQARRCLVNTSQITWSVLLFYATCVCALSAQLRSLDVPRDTQSLLGCEGQFFTWSITNRNVPADSVFFSIYQV